MAIVAMSLAALLLAFLLNDGGCFFVNMAKARVVAARGNVATPCYVDFF